MVGNLKPLAEKITETRISWFIDEYRHERKELARLVRQIKKNKLFYRVQAMRDDTGNTKN